MRSEVLVEPDRSGDADLVRRPTRRSAVALIHDDYQHRVGYANAYALSTAFYRLSGLRPSEHRTQHRVAV